MKYLDFILSQKGKDVAMYDTRNESNLVDYIFVQHFTSAAENKKFADAFMQEFKLDKFPEGYLRGEWIIFDLGDVVIHSFISEKRAKYNLDKLWQNKKIEIKKNKK